MSAADGGLTRTIRTGARIKVRAGSVLATALLGELLAPGDVVWLVSPWISDVRVLDNSQGAYDHLFGDSPPSSCSLSQMLARVANAGAVLRVVTRPDSHNDDFLGRLHTLIGGDRLDVERDPVVHEKTLCGRDWVLSGSMNFTFRGLLDNDEAVTYRVGGSDAAQARLDLAQRWSRHA